MWVIVLSQEDLLTNLFLIKHKMYLVPPELNQSRHPVAPSGHPWTDTPLPGWARVCLYATVAHTAWQAPWPQCQRSKTQEDLCHTTRSLAYWKPEFSVLHTNLKNFKYQCNVEISHGLFNANKGMHHPLTVLALSMCYLTPVQPTPVQSPFQKPYTVFHNVPITQIFTTTKVNLGLCLVMS